MDAEFRRLLVSLPDDWRTHDRYIEWLHDQARHAEAESVAQRWLTRNGKRKDLGLDPAMARTRLARAQQAQGKLDPAWKSIQPALGSGAFGPLSRAARILAARKKDREAMEIAIGLEKRYGPTGSIFIAELHWRAGKHDEAARALFAAPKRLSDRDWEVVVGKSFAEVFAGRPDEALIAFSALSNAGLPFGLQWGFARAINDGALRFTILSALRPTVEFHAMGLMADRWTAKKLAEGEGAADAWLRAQPNWTTNPVLLFVLYEAGAWNVLWDVVPPTTPGDETDNFWEMRAMAAVRQNDAKRIAELAERYRQTLKGGRYDLLGRYLVGLVPEEEIRPLTAGRPGHAAEVAMVIAVRREAAGNLDAANDWYRAVIETGSKGDGEYRAANRELNRWHEKKRTLAKAN